MHGLCSGAGVVFSERERNQNNTATNAMPYADVFFCSALRGLCSDDAVECPGSPGRVASVVARAILPAKTPGSCPRLRWSGLTTAMGRSGLC